jgi:hypothetical protein
MLYICIKSEVKMIGLKFIYFLLLLLALGSCNELGRESPLMENSTASRNEKFTGISATDSTDTAMTACSNSLETDKKMSLTQLYIFTIN